VFQRGIVWRRRALEGTIEAARRKGPGSASKLCREDQGGINLSETRGELRSCASGVGQSGLRLKGYRFWA